MDRAAQLSRWFAATVLTDGQNPPDLAPVAGDASFRRYYRVPAREHTVILCDSPPDTEKNLEFATIARALASSGVRVPAILHQDLERGFFVLEDLGDQTLLPLLDAQQVDKYYAEALHMLEKLAVASPSAFELDEYGASLLIREMDLFPEWFCEGLLGMSLNDEAQAVYSALRDALCERAIAQLQVVVHRDFHARNLMVLADDSLASIDFQDAVRGPVTYDPVSLLKDCYLRWPAAQVRVWALQHREALLLRGLPMPASDHFLTDFDFMGLQRHIKVLGIFARLYLRDRKPAYLGDLPRVIAYVRSALAEYPQVPALATFARWFESEVMPAAARQDWFADAG